MGSEPEGGGKRVTEACWSRFGQLVVLELIAAVFCLMISGSVFTYRELRGRDLSIHQFKLRPYLTGLANEPKDHHWVVFYVFELSESRL